MVNRFVSQGTGTGNDTNFTQHVDVAGHDTNFALTGSDDTWAVRTNQTQTFLSNVFFNVQHIQNGNTFSDTHDQGNTCISSFQDGILTEGSWYVNYSCITISCGFRFSNGVEYWQTVVFTVLTVSQLFHSLAVRSEAESLFSIGLFSNRPMLGAITLTLLLQLAVIYLPAMNAVFHTRPLPLFDLAACLALSSLVLFAVEIEKVLVRRNLIYRENPAGSV